MIYGTYIDKYGNVIEVLPPLEPTPVYAKPERKEIDFTSYIRMSNHRIEKKRRQAERKELERKNVLKKRKAHVKDVWIIITEIAGWMAIIGMLYICYKLGCFNY